MNRVELDNVLECYRFIVDKILESPKDKCCIVHKNIAEYDGYVSSLFKKNNISFDRNYSFSLLSDVFCVFVISLLKFIKFDFDIDFFIDFLEVVPYIDIEELGVLRNYLVTYRVDDLTKEFDIRPFIDRGEDDELNISRMRWLNDIKVKCVDLIDEIRSFVQNKRLYDLIIFLSRKFEYDKLEFFGFFNEILCEIGDKCANIDYFLKQFIDKISNVDIHLGGKNIELLKKTNLKFNNFVNIFVILENTDEYNVEFDSSNSNMIFLYSKGKIESSDNFFSKKKKYFKIGGVFSKKTDGKYKDLGTDLLKVNISQIEKYYLCPFSYFCSNILKLREIKAFEFDKREYGLLMHHVLEYGMKKYIENGELVESYGVVLEYLNNRFYKIYQSNMIVNMSKNISVDLDLFIKSIIKMCEEKKLKTIFLEKRVHKEINFDGILVSISGIIDRIDLKGEQILVVDYKTSEKKFNLNNFLYGIGAQIIIYLDMLNLDNYEKYGAVYMSYKKGEIDNTEQLDELTKNLKISGVSLGLCDKIYNVDEVGIKLVLCYSSFLVKNIINNVLNFEFKNCVTCMNKKNSCNDCKYHKICHNFSVIYRDIKKFDLSNIYKEMEKKTNVKFD